jgi:hypothetical protein
MAHYVKNKDLFNEIIISKAQGKLTPVAVDMFIRITAEASKKLKYKDEMDREDCIGYALEDLLKYWKGFNPEKSKNAFAYYTQMTKNGFAKGWKKLHPPKMKQMIPLGNEDGGIYNI